MFGNELMNALYEIFHTNIVADEVKFTGNAYSFIFTLEKSRKIDYISYSDYEVVIIKKYDENRYTLVIESISGCNSVSHSIGYGYDNCPENWIMDKDHIVKYINEYTKNLYTFANWK